MTPKPVFLDVDRSIVESKLRITGDDPAEEELRKLFPEDKYPSKVVKPHPGFCIKSKEVGTERKVFVNICYTDAIPPPPAELTEAELVDIRESAPCEFRVPLSIGDPHSESDKKGNNATAIDVAINDTFFNKIQASALFRQFVIAVAFEGISDKHKLHTTDDRIMLKNRKAYGTLQLHRIQQRDVQQQMQTPFEELSGGSCVQQPTKPMIETLSSVTYDLESSKAPEFRLFKKNCESGYLYGEFRMLNVLNINELTLDIGEDRIILESKRSGYFLDVFVPCCISQDTVEANFNRNSKILTVKMGLKDSSKASSTS